MQQNVNKCLSNVLTVTMVLITWSQSLESVQVLRVKLLRLTSLICSLNHLLVSFPFFMLTKYAIILFCTASGLQERMATQSAYQMRSFTFDSFSKKIIEKNHLKFGSICRQHYKQFTFKRLFVQSYLTIENTTLLNVGTAMSIGNWKMNVILRA